MNGLVVVRNMHLSPNMACQFPQSCRICAQKNRTLISVYGEEGLLRQLITKLEYCLQIIVLENDGLPTTICWKCLSKLEICFELMQERIKGENEFRKRMMVIDALPITMEKTEVKIEEREEAMNDDEQPSTYGLPNHQTQCHCETCTLRHDEQTQHAEISEPRSASPPIYHHSAPCQCEQCISRYGSLPLLADAIDRSDAASSTSSYSKHSELSYSETSAAETRPGSSESGGPIRASVTKKVINCEFCGKLFSHTGDLNKHRRRHTGERPYPCSQCSRCFSHASNLLRHQKIHSGEMPHECPVCNKRFSRKDKMVNHIKNCHKSCPSPQP